MIMETLKRHLPVSGNEGLSDLRKISVRFEEKTYTAAISQSDYLRKISFKMLTMETNSMVPSNKPLDSDDDADVDPVSEPCGPSTARPGQRSSDYQHRHMAQYLRCQHDYQVASFAHLHKCQVQIYSFMAQVNPHVEALPLPPLPMPPAPYMDFSDEEDD